MNRKKFMLSWGRKNFFGLSWPLSCLMSLLCLKAYIIPQDAVSIIYYLSHTIALNGFFHCILYFVFFWPVVSLFPYYYVTRFWAVLLISLFNTFLLVDSMIFTELRFHVNELILRIAASEGIGSLFDTKASLYLVIGFFFVLMIGLWVRGEFIWRTMQRRFSNPVSNWYFALIFVLIGVSHLSYRSSLARNFVFDYHLGSKKTAPELSSARVFYPKKKLTCQSKSTPTIVMVTLDDLPKSDFHHYLVPQLDHLKSHGVTYDQHSSGMTSSEDGLFSVYYSLPALFKDGVAKTKPVLFQELEKRKYDTIVLSQLPIPGLVKEENVIKSGLRADLLKILSEQDSDKPKAIFLNYKRDFGLDNVDREVGEVTIDLQKNGLLKDTFVLFLGITGDAASKVPFVYHLPNKKSQKLQAGSHHYDVMPTLLKDSLGCSLHQEDVFGKILPEGSLQDLSLFSEGETISVVRTSDNKAFKTNFNGVVLSGESLLEEEGSKILKLLRKVSSLYRP